MTVMPTNPMPGPTMVSRATPRPRRPLSLWSLLVWAYHDQLVGGAYGTSGMGGGIAYQSSTDGVAQMLKWAELNCWIDGGEWRGLSDRMHPDAKAVAEALWSLDSGTARLIAEHARRGEQPEPPTVAPCPFPTVVDSRAEEHFGRAVIGGQRVDYRIKVAERVVERIPRLDFRGRGRRVVVGYDLVPTDVPYCPLTWWPSAEMVAHEAAVCEAFAAGMRRLAEVMADVELRDHVVDGVGV